MKAIACPNCNTGNFLKEISYGMPEDDCDESRFYMGGCIPGTATVHCSKCEWENDEGVIDFPVIF